ncbi:hypothetical protein ABKU49_05455 [Enterobacter hormaechei]
MCESIKSGLLAEKDSANVEIVRQSLELVVNKGVIWLINKLWSHDLVWHGTSLGEIGGWGVVET